MDPVEDVATVVVDTLVDDEVDVVVVIGVAEDETEACVVGVTIVDVLVVGTVLSSMSSGLPIISASPETAFGKMTKFSSPGIRNLSLSLSRNLIRILASKPTQYLPKSFTTVNLKTTPPT